MAYASEKKVLLIYFITALANMCSGLLNSCIKEKTDLVLPDATQTGANTIGFRIDGQVWIPFRKCGFLSDPCGRIRAEVASPTLDFQFGREQGNGSSSLSISHYRGSITSEGEKIDSVLVSYTAGNGSGFGIYDGPLSGSSFR